MSTNHPPVSGIIGNIIINSYDYKMQSTALPINSSKSIPFIDQMQGSKTVMIHAGGVIRTDFNPFSGASPPTTAKLNTFAVIKCEDQIGVEYATCPSALITLWDYKSEADGVATWEMVAVGNFTFEDFSHTTA